MGERCGIARSRQRMCSSVGEAGLPGRGPRTCVLGREARTARRIRWLERARRGAGGRRHGGFETYDSLLIHLRSLEGLVSVYKSPA